MIIGRECTDGNGPIRLHAISCQGPSGSDVNKVGMVDLVLQQANSYVNPSNDALQLCLFQATILWF